MNISIFATVFFVFIALLWFMVINLNRRIKDFEKHEVLLLSMKAKPYAIMLYSFLCLLLYVLCALDGVSFADLIIIMTITFTSSLLIVIAYYRIGYVGFCDNKMVVIPLIGKKKEYNYNELFAYVKLSNHLLSPVYMNNPVIAITKKENPAWLKEHPLIFTTSLITIIGGFSYKGAYAEFLIADDILVERTKNVWHSERWKSFKG